MSSIEQIRYEGMVEEFAKRNEELVEKAKEIAEKEEKIAEKEKEITEKEKEITEKAKEIAEKEKKMQEEVAEKVTEEVREEGIQAVILDNLEEQIPKERILMKLQKHFQLTEEKSKQYYEKFAIRV